MTDRNVLARHGIEGEDATTAIRVFEERGGLPAAYEALASHFGHDAVRVAVVLMKEEK